MNLVGSGASRDRSVVLYMCSGFGHRQMFKKMDKVMVDTVIFKLNGVSVA